MHESIVKDPKMEDPKKPRENQPEQFPSRKRQENPGQSFEEDRDADQQFTGKEYGEGNYKAAKEYDDATRDFVRLGRVEGAARDAEPRTGEEARELAEAEARGRARSKGEDAEAKPAAQKRKRGNKR